MAPNKENTASVEMYFEYFLSIMFTFFDDLSKVESIIQLISLLQKYLNLAEFSK